MVSMAELCGVLLKTEGENVSEGSVTSPWLSIVATSLSSVRNWTSLHLLVMLICIYMYLQ